MQPPGRVGLARKTRLLCFVMGVKGFSTHPFSEVLDIHIALLGCRSAFYIGNKFGIAPAGIAWRNSYPFREVWIALLEDVCPTTTDNSRYFSYSGRWNNVRRGHGRLEGRIACMSHWSSFALSRSSDPNSSRIVSPPRRHTALPIQNYLKLGSAFQISGTSKGSSHPYFLGIYES